MRRQSDHLQDYRDALARLRELDLIYRCFRTRAEVLAAIGQAPHGDAPAEDVFAPLRPAEEARLLSEDRPFAWRLSTARSLAHLGATPLDFLEDGSGPAGEHGRIVADLHGAQDVVVARKDLGVSYHLAVVVDDAAQGVTHVVRGQDLFAAVGVQRMLQALLGLPTPTYAHHRLILRPDGGRFAKRDTAETLRDLRARGVGPAELRAQLGLAGTRAAPILTS